MPLNTKPAGASGGLPELTVANWKPFEKGFLLGFSSIILHPGVLINGVMILRKGEQRFLGWPSKEFTKRDGTTGYQPIIEFATKELGQECQAAVLTALDRFIEEGGNGR